MHPLKRGWILLDHTERRVLETTVGLVAAVGLTLATLAVGIGVLLWLAGAYSALALEAFLRAVLQALRPSTRHERRQARRVLRAVGLDQPEVLP